jgi:O-antigen/teichoic acid export membrane protein
MEAESRRELLTRVRSRTGSGFLWIFSTTIVWQLSSWALTVITARILTPRDYGLLALSEAVLPYFIVLATLKLEVFLVQSDKLTDREDGSLQFLLLILGVVATILAFFAAFGISSFYKEPEVLAPLQAISMLFLIRATQIVPESKLKRDLRFKEIGLTNLAIGLVRGILQLVLAIIGFSYWSLVIGNLLSEIAKSLTFRLLDQRRLRLNYNRDIWLRAARFGASASMATAAWLLFSTADSLIVGRLFGVNFLGLYAMAVFLMDLPLSKMNGMLSPIVLPYYAKLRSHPLVLKRSFLRLNSGLMGIVAPALIGGAVIAPVFFPLLLGEKWRGLVLPFQILAMVGILKTIPANAQHILYSLDKPNDVLRITAVPSLILPVSFLTFGYLLRDSFSQEALGIYLVWLLIYPVVGPLYTARVLSRGAGIPEKQFLSCFVPPIVSSFLMGLVVLAVTTPLYDSPVISTAVGILVGALIYLVSLRAIFPRYFLQSIVILRRLYRRR